MKNLPRNEYPRPQFVRDGWLNLNGVWDFSFDTDCFDRVITVPYAHQTKLSGIDIQDFHDIVWYRKRFVLPDWMKDKTVLLHFGAVDYYCRLWVNGRLAAEHTGGHISFNVDISDYVQDGENEIKLYVEDAATDLEIPRGKQYWEEKSHGIFYTRTTGIWQTVWLEAPEHTHISNVMITPNLDAMTVGFEFETKGQPDAELDIKITFEGKLAA